MSEPEITVFYFDGSWQVRCRCGYRASGLWPALAAAIQSAHEQTCAAALPDDAPPVRCGQLLHLPDLVILCGDEATGTCPTCGHALCVTCALPDGRCEACVLNCVGAGR